MTFYFYDLETSSGSPRTGRVMQFAGQRTNENLEPIGDPDNILVALADDVLPEPDAILVHGITPQQTVSEGMSEADFAAWFNEKIAQQDTVFIGYNNIRFDDEFMRSVCYRTFHDPYEWHWKNGRSRWDLLDAMRMMRALRPEGLQWPFIDNKPTVKLELMAKENDIVHENAHDALSDVLALIELARRFQQSQPKLFQYLLKTRDKKFVATLASDEQPFVYTSGKYESEHQKTTVVQGLFKHPRRDTTVVYDLRYNPTEWFDKSAKELATHWAVRWGDDIERLPVKTLQHNKCPAIAPMSVLDEKSKQRIGYDDSFMRHRTLIMNNEDFTKKLMEALDIIENEQQTSLPLEQDVDKQMYDGFWSDADRNELIQIRQSDPNDFAELQKKIKNARLREMMPLYKARNYPSMLTVDENIAWEAYRRKKILSGDKNSQFTRVFSRLQEIATTRSLSSRDEYLLSELQLYYESIVPEPESDTSEL